MLKQQGHARRGGGPHRPLAEHRGQVVEVEGDGGVKVAFEGKLAYE